MFSANVLPRGIFPDQTIVELHKANGQRKPPEISQGATFTSERHVTGFKSGRKASDHVAIYFSFASDWLRKYRKFFKLGAQRAEQNHRKLLLILTSKLKIDPKFQIL